MKMNIYFRVSINIILIFAIVIGMSFAADNLHEFLGDNHCIGRFFKGGNSMDLNNFYGCDDTHGATAYQTHPATWHWGYRHWVWMLMGFCLFVTQVIRIGSIINKNGK